MKLCKNSPTIGFLTQYGRFTITPISDEENLFTLAIVKIAFGLRELGIYRSINDAILAVAKQETGYLPWDSLYPKQVPHNVRDIACWDFEEISGTKSAQPCSQSAG
jgi:hypothetical protein